MEFEMKTYSTWELRIPLSAQVRAWFGEIFNCLVQAQEWRVSVSEGNTL